MYRFCFVNKGQIYNLNINLLLIQYYEIMSRYCIVI